MTIHLVFALLACVLDTNAQKRISDLETRLASFPPSNVVDDNLDISRKHLSWLEEAGAAMPAHHQEAHSKCIAEAGQLYNAWRDLARARMFLKKARHPSNSVLKRNASTIPPWFRDEVTFDECLLCAELFTKRLEEKLGEEAFALGRMPPPVPVWRFQWID